MPSVPRGDRRRRAARSACARLNAKIDQHDADQHRRRDVDQRLDVPAHVEALMISRCSSHGISITLSSKRQAPPTGTGAAGWSRSRPPRWPATSAAPCSVNRWMSDRMRRCEIIAKASISSIAREQVDQLVSTGGSFARLVCSSAPSRMWTSMPITASRNAVPRNSGDAEDAHLGAGRLHQRASSAPPTASLSDAAPATPAASRAAPGASATPQGTNSAEADARIGEQLQARRPFEQRQVARPSTRGSAPRGSSSARGASTGCRPARARSRPARSS